MRARTRPCGARAGFPPSILVCAALLALPGRAFAAQAVAKPGAPIHPAPVALEAEFESRDGEVQDLAAERVSPANPDDQRVWVAQGRVRAALKATTRERIVAEDAAFSSAWPGRYEKLLAVEVDQAGPVSYLYTLTELDYGVRSLGTYHYHGLVYREQISAPYSSAQPGPRHVLELPLTVVEHSDPALSRYETVRDLRVWRAADKLVVLTNYAVHVLGDAPTGLTHEGATQELLEAQQSSLLADDPGWLGYPNCAVAPERIASFDRMALGDENGPAPGGVRAYVLAVCTGYCGKPFPRVVLVCNLEAGAPAWSAPTFDINPAPGAERFVYFNPADVLSPGGSGCAPITGAQCDGAVCPSCTGPLGEFVPAGNAGWEFGAWDVDVFAVPRAAPYQLRAYVACGAMRQVQIIDLTDAFTDPGHQFAPQQVVLNPTQTVFKVCADPDVPDKRFYALTPSTAHVAQHSGTAWTSATLTGESFGALVSWRDEIVVDLVEPTSQITRTLWNAAFGGNDWVFKVVNVTAGAAGVPKMYDPPATPAADPQKLPWIAACDGGVALIDHAAKRYAVYLLVFGGILRYEPVLDPTTGRADLSKWVEVQSSYVPSVDPFTGAPFPTEQVEIVETSPGQRRLGMAAGTGAFFDFTIDPATLDPNPPKVVDAKAQWYAQAGWTPFQAVYGHELVYLELGGQLYAAVDLANQENNDAALQLFRYEPTLDPPWCLVGVWVQKGLTGLIPFPVGNYVLSLSVVEDAQGAERWGFLGFKGGFVAFDLTQAQSCPVGPVPVFLFNPSYSRLVLSPQSPDGDQYDVWSVRAADIAGTDQDRLLVAADHGTEGSHLFVHAWNSATGTPVAAPTWHSSATDFPFEAPSGGLMKGRFLMVDPAAGCGDFYVSDRAGYLYEFRWQASLPDRLEYVAHWKSDYGYLVNDCRVVQLHPGPGGERLLAIKDREAFAFIDPFQTCK